MKVRRKSDAEVFGEIVDRVVGVLGERTDRDEVKWEGEGLGPYFLGIGEWEIWLRTETPEERSFRLRLERGGEACEVEVADRGVL